MYPNFQSIDILGLRFWLAICPKGFQKCKYSWISLRIDIYGFLRPRRCSFDPKLFLFDANKYTSRVDELYDRVS